jgi:hypothetical protein
VCERGKVAQKRERELRRSRRRVRLTLEWSYSIVSIHVPEMTAVQA